MAPAYAQEPDPSKQEPTQPSSQPEQSADAQARLTPRGSIQGYFNDVEQGNLTQAAEYLDQRNLPRVTKRVAPERLAEMLAIVIGREIWIDLEELSNDPAGETGDGLPTYRDELGRIKDGDREFILLMQRVPDGQGGHAWKISNATVATIPDLYSRFGYGAVTEAIAKAVPDVHFLGIELFKWVVTIVVGLVVYPVALLLGLGLARLMSSPSSPLYPRVRKFFMGPFSILLVVLLMHRAFVGLGLGITGQKIARAETLTTIVVVWLLMHATALIRDSYTRRLAERGRDGAIVLVQPATQAIRVVIIVIATLVWLDNAGFNITTIVAGLGVGGVAVALALQKPLEDIFGALTLYTQQPFRIGDFCRVGTQMGTVEEIGLRTTRIRTLANSLISVPNHKLAAEPIDNYSARRKILYNPTVRLRVDTSPEQLDKVLEGIRSLLQSHEKVIQDGARVRFQKIGVDALELNVFAYADVQVFADYLEVAEDLNMKILSIVEQAGSTLALPGQTLYVEGAGGRD